MFSKKPELNYYYTEVKKYNEYTSLQKEYQLSQINIKKLIKIYKYELFKKTFNNFVINYQKRPRRRRSFISELISQSVKDIIETNKTFKLNDNKKEDATLYSSIITNYFRNKYIKKN
tara:strand:- start:1098 stop:1448 length:351 start_codon:yes stop_codon:yes gene_type:complete